MQDFSISIDSATTEETGVPCARIVVGDWQEAFALAPMTGHADPRETLPTVWRRELQRLVGGASAVVLPAQPGRAWVLYREAGEVFVQDQLFLADDGAGQMALDDAKFVVRPRRAKSDDGQSVSEWNTSIRAIQIFLEGAAL